LDKELVGLKKRGKKQKVAAIRKPWALKRGGWGAKEEGKKTVHVEEKKARRGSAAGRGIQPKEEEGTNGRVAVGKEQSMQMSVKLEGTTSRGGKKTIISKGGFRPRGKPPRPGKTRGKKKKNANRQGSRMIRKGGEREDKRKGRSLYSKKEPRKGGTAYRPWCPEEKITIKKKRGGCSWRKSPISIGENLLKKNN